MTSSKPTRWDTQLIANKENWQAYIERFTGLHDSGADTAGEARFVDAIAERGSTILDGGCGSGRVGAALHVAGHQVAGVDKDAGHIAIGRSRYPGLPLLAHDLLTLDAETLGRAHLPSEFDIIVLAGNVMVYLAPGSERDVLANLTRLLRPAGKVVVGFATDREYGVDQLDKDAEAVGLALQQRFATWQLAPYDKGADWAVSMYVRAS